MTQANNGATRYDADADAARDRLASTVDDLQDRLSPRTLARDAVDDLQERGGEILESASNLVRRNPVAISLIGASLGLLLLARRSTRSDEEVYPYAKDRDEPGLGERVSAKAEDLRAKAAESLSAARDRAAETAERARLRASEARQRTAETFDGNPLAGALIGVVAGALVGALLPRTEQEDELLGETRDRLKDAAKSAARAAADTGRDQLAELGLSAEDAKARVAELRDQAGGVAKTVARAASDEFKAQADGTAV